MFLNDAFNNNNKKPLKSEKQSSFKTIQKWVNFNKGAKKSVHICIV